MQDVEVVEIASLLHDIQDWKYSGSETAGANAAQVIPIITCASSVGQRLRWLQ